jgi:hypothetical protein
VSRKSQGELMKSRSKYRRLWEKNFGPIPLDEKGISFEIHHIDRDSSNNELSNLQCVSLQEHYDIHFAQGDYWACQAISFRLKMPEEERLQMIKLSALSRKGILRPDMTGNNNPMRNPEYVKNFSDATKGMPKSSEGRAAIALGHRNRSLKKIECNFCHIITNDVNYKRWHGENCISNPLLTSNELLELKKLRITNFTKSNPSKVKYKCQYCKKYAGSGNYKRWHGENCKRKMICM